MKLTDTKIRNAKPEQKQYKMTDGRGLYLLVTKTGKYFRWDYRFAGKRKTFALGVYPDVTLKDARELHIDYRRMLAKGIDPNEYKKQSKRQLVAETANSFEVVAREWFLKNQHTWSEKHAKTIIGRLEKNVFPWLGKTDVSSITAKMLLDVLRKIEDRGALETAHRVKRICGQVFEYAISTERTEKDPTRVLKKAIPPTIPRNMATIIDPDKVGVLMRAIDGYHGNMVTRSALKFAPLTFVRPGELRHAEWKEINIQKAEWRIPFEKMKMTKLKKEKMKGHVHMVPLSIQAVKVLEEIEPLTGEGKFIFPSLRSTHRPMSENTINAALRGMGFSKEEITGHGFRGMASTLLHENGWPSYAIERQLAHIEKNSVKDAYNHAEYLHERIEMMQWWACYLDCLRDKN